MSTLQFETTVAADGTITLPTSCYDAAEFVNKTVRVVVERESLPKGFDPLMLGIIDPAKYGRMIIVGDIIAPIDVEWEAMQ